nr:hypothetical protein [Helicobacter pylori]
MTMTFDHNNNSEECQMFFDKINNGSPLGLSLSLDQFYRILKTYCLLDLAKKACFLYMKTSRVQTFNLKNYLLVLAKMHCNPTAICYCGNKQDAQNTNTKEIKFLSAKSHDFGKEMDSISVELSNSNTFIQSLLKLGSFLHGKTIESLNNPTNYPPINLVVTPALAPWKTTVEIEEHRKNITFDHYRQSSAQNIKINEIANDLKSGKIVGTKIISDALLSANYCFMDDENLKDLKKLLSQD